MSEQLPMVVRQLHFMLDAYLPRIGAGAYVGQVKVECVGEGQHTLTIGASGINIDTGWEVTLPTLDGNKKVPGFRVFVMETIRGGRNHPDEQVDVTTLETVQIWCVVEEVGRLIAHDAMSGLPDFPADPLGNPIGVEQV
jgi:hypothetical protein